MEIENPLISVIIPVYNVEKYLERCVESIIKQTYTNLEIILIDDGSEDRSGLICDRLCELDSRIVVYHKENGGLSSARNHGIIHAKGEYIGFVDSDDWVDCRMYEVLMTNLLKYKADVSDIESITTDKEISVKNKAEIITVKRGRDILTDYFLSDRYSVCRKLYSREVIGDVRFPVGKINEDIATNFIMLKNATCLVKSNQKMYYYYINTNSITGSVFRARDFDLIDACELLLKESEYDSVLYSLAKVKLGISYYSLLGRYILYKNENIENLSERIAILHSNLRRAYKILLYSHINIKKKIMISIVMLFKPDFLKWVASVLKR